ncbi:MAG: hypothetical protein OXE17_02985 [Chloroflexi bacterium]|nr:hypothetical protein [Chloroflexota bacterium]
MGDGFTRHSGRVGVVQDPVKIGAGLSAPHDRREVEEFNNAGTIY